MPYLFVGFCTTNQIQFDTYFIEMDANISEMDISKPGKIKPRLSIYQDYL